MKLAKALIVVRHAISNQVLFMTPAEFDRFFDNRDPRDWIV